MKQARDHFFKFLAGKKLKLTAQRSLICDVLFNCDEHVSPESLYATVKKKDASVGQATIYRTLKLLSESGLAREVNFGDGVTRYEPNFGKNHHDHLICEKCGKSVEILDHRIEAIQEELAALHGFTLTNHRMNLFGLCQTCKDIK